MSLLSLPLELLQDIAGYLETAYRPSLEAFSLTNSVCHTASLPITFQRVCITVDSPEGLRRHVDALRGALSRTDSFSYIRHITVKGALRLRDKKKIEGYATRAPLASFPYDTREALNAQLLNEEPIDYEGIYTVHVESVIERSSEEDLAWAPLVKLLEEANISLEDIVFDCRSQFPPCLLRILDERHPRCRLHHLTFK